VDYPGTPFNQLLGQNDSGQAAGYYSTKADGTGPDYAYIYDEYGSVFELLNIPASTSAQATGINNSGNVCGFFVDAIRSQSRLGTDRRAFRHPQCSWLGLGHRPWV